MTPMDHDFIPEATLRYAIAGTKTVLATVIETWGSAPRLVGSQMVITEAGDMIGSVSGGCVEGAVVTEALQLLVSGNSKILEFSVADADAFSVGLTCGGRIRVMLQPVGIGAGPSVELFEELVKMRSMRAPVAYVVNIDKWTHSLKDPEDVAFSDVFKSEKSTLIENRFIGLHLPPLRMVIVGAVHIAQPLVSMARQTGYDVTIIDPRDSFGSVARFPNETIVKEWPDEALMEHGVDARTAVITLTHDPKLDNPAIKTALRSDVFYLGCLGSKKTHARRVAELVNAGFTKLQIDRIHGPVGLDIGAKSPSEIAVSIMAEVTLRLRRPETRQ